MKSISLLLSPSIVWLVVYIPALFYFILTRLPSSSTNRILYGMEYGIPITQSILFHPYDVSTRVNRGTSTIDTSISNTSRTVSSNDVDINNNVNQTIRSCHKLLNLFYFTKSVSIICNHERFMNNNNNNNNTTTTIQQMNDVTSTNTTSNRIPNHFDLKYPLQQIYQLSSSSSSSSSSSNPHTMISDIIYRYDSTLGRGYILYTTHSNDIDNDSSNSNNNQNHNRIYRFEIGYGIVPIGRTLFMENACCRSNHHVNCSSTDRSMSRFCGPLVMEYTHSSSTDTLTTSTSTGTSDTNIDGKLVIAEYGEQRIVRLEEDNGARTPLVMHIPCIVDDISILSNASTNTSSSPLSDTSSLCIQRLPNPHHMIYMPNGHLMLVINDIHIVQGQYCEEMNHAQQCIVKNNDTSKQQLQYQHDEEKEELGKRSALVIVPNTKQVPPIPNLQISREAHYWDTMQHRHHDPQVQHDSLSFNYTKANQLPYVFYTDPSIVWFGNIVIAGDGRTLFGCGRKVVDTTTNESKLVLFRLLLHSKKKDNKVDDDDDDDDDDDVNTSNYAPRSSNDISIVMDLANYTHTTMTATTSSRSSNDFATQQAQNCCIVTIGQMGVLYVSIYNDILLIDPNIGHVIGTIQIPIPASIIRTDTEPYISAMTLGGDGYLYIGTNYYSSLYRIRTKDRPIIFAA
jgi:hypothetical protein